MKLRLGSAAIGLLFLSATARSDRPDRRGYVFDEADRLPPGDERPGTSSTGVTLVDVDDDGDLDLFLAEGTAAIDPRPNKLYINDGRGSFTDESALRLPAGEANSTRADFADVDSDGDLDGVVANVGPEQLLLNDGAGRFVDGSGQLPPPPPLFSDISSHVRFADVNDDGCPDILVSNENPFDPSPLGGAQNRLLLNGAERRGHHGRVRCTGRFTDETAARLPALTDQSAAMLTADIDRDGDLDIVVLNRGQERVLLNDGDGFFTEETAARLPVITDSTRGGALVDLNRDGWPDLVTANSRNQPPQVYWNTGRGFFAKGSFGYTEAPDETDTDLQVADLDRDGYPDLYIGNAGRFDSGHGFEGGPDHFFENHRGTFVEATARHFSFPAAQASTAAAFGDLDGDGDLDLVVAGTGDGELGRERVFVQRGRRGHGHDHGD